MEACGGGHIQIADRPHLPSNKIWVAGLLVYNTQVPLVRMSGCGSRDKNPHQHYWSIPLGPIHTIIIAVTYLHR